MPKSSDRTALRFIFDVGGVLVRHDDSLLCERIAALCSEPEEARRQLREILQDRGIGTGETGSETLYRRLVTAVDFCGDYSHFLSLWSSHFSEITEMIPVLDRLSRYHRIVLFSNTNEAHWSYLTRCCKVLRYANAQYLSYQLGLVKPDAASFRFVLEREGCPADKCFFVDDRPENVAAARAAGMIAHAFTRPEDFMNILSQLRPKVRY